MNTGHIKKVFRHEIFLVDSVPNLIQELPQSDTVRKGGT